jgi:hypothetical protein
MKTLKLITILITIGLYSCESREEKIKSEWKFVDGFRVADFLSFKNQNLKLRNDNIYKNSKPFALIVELKNERFLGTGNKLILRDIESGKLGTYTDKGE